MVDTAGSSCAEKMCYIKTQKGVILTAETILNFSVVMCYATIFVFPVYLAFSIIELIFSILYFVVFSMEWDKMGRGIIWVWSDLFRAVTAAVVYIIISIQCMVFTWYTLLILAGVFGLVAGLLYGYDTYTIFKQIRSSMQHTAAPSGTSSSA